MQHQSCVTDECHQDTMLIISISFLEIYVRRINDDDFVTLLFLFRREIYARRKLLPHDVIDNIARTNNNPLLLTGSIVSSRWTEHDNILTMPYGMIEDDHKEIDKAQR